jgi:hypothetical protein
MGWDMKDDPPTIPSLHWDDAPGREPGGVPTWPTAPRMPAVSGLSNLGGQPLLLFFSLVLNGVLFACFVFALVLARAGVLGPPGGSGELGNRTGTSGLVLGTPTATTSPTPGAGQLEVDPSSIDLSCNSGQQSQFVVLRNPGTESVSWSVQYPSSQDQSNVTVNPSSSDIRAGGSVSIQIQLRRRATNGDGSIRFNTGSNDNSSSDSLTSLSYSITGCSGG